MTVSYNCFTSLLNVFMHLACTKNNETRKIENRKMEPRIELVKEKKRIGKKTTMPFSENETFKHWHSFMPHRKEIVNYIFYSNIS